MNTILFLAGCVGIPILTAIAVVVADGSRWHTAAEKWVLDGLRDCETTGDLDGWDDGAWDTAAAGLAGDA